MKFWLAILVGKLVRLLGMAVGRATNKPGEIALKICPDILTRFKIRSKIIAVTGSNGKTTTANLISYILRKTKNSVANNAKGSNMTGGIVTTFLSACGPFGGIRKSFLVLEVDERYSPIIFKDIKPDILLCTNLFRDQPTRNGSIDIIAQKLEGAVSEKTTVVLNGNDPISMTLFSKAVNRVYYGYNRSNDPTDEVFSITNDMKLCPICFGRLSYDYRHYNHIGRFRCESCGFSTPELAYTAAEGEENIFYVNGFEVSTELKTPQNILNTTGAIATLATAGIAFRSVCQAASTFSIPSQRFMEMNIGSRKAVLILSKNQNSVSFDSSIDYVLNDDSVKSIIIYVGNINHTGQRDTTWLYDIAFERIGRNVNCMICTGARAYDLAVRLKVADIPENRIIIEPDVSKLSNVAMDAEGTIYILTELYDAECILSELKRMKKFFKR